MYRTLCKLLEGGYARFTNYWGGRALASYAPFLRLCMLHIPEAVSCLHVPTCNVYAINLCTLGHRSTVQCLFPLSHAPFTDSNSSISCCLQDAMFNNIMGIWVYKIIHASVLLSKGNKNISYKMLKDVGMTVPKSRETSAICSNTGG